MDTIDEQAVWARVAQAGSGTTQPGQRLEAGLLGAVEDARGRLLCYGKLRGRYSLGSFLRQEQQIYAQLVGLYRFYAGARPKSGGRGSGDTLGWLLRETALGAGRLEALGQEAEEPARGLLLALGVQEQRIWRGLLGVWGKG